MILRALLLVICAWVVVGQNSTLFTLTPAAPPAAKEAVGVVWNDTYMIVGSG